MDTHQLSDAVQQIRWRHTIDLGHGIITPGNDPTPKRLHYLSLPHSLKGKSVLDIGAWDGFYSFEAERRGAQRVVALDIWNPKGPVSKEGFELARRTLNSKVEDIDMSLFDVTRENIGQFDIVLFLGVLYHLRHPLLALERLHSVTGEVLILESHIDMPLRGKPFMAFYPDAELNRDSTNWWGPNPAALKAMLRVSGFRDIKVVSSWPSLPRRFCSAVSAGLRRPRSFFDLLSWKRIIIHARP